MSAYKFDPEYLEVGDTFEGGPIEQSYFISAVMSVGGEIEIDGDTVIILKLPKNSSNQSGGSFSAKAPVLVEDQKAMVTPMAQAPVVEAPKVEAPKVVETPKVVEAPKVEVPAAPKLVVNKPTPKAPAAEKTEE